MKDELVDVLNADGNLTGREIGILEAHQRGVYHRNSHIWIYNSKGEVLLQKRAKQKLFYPNLWDISAAGHVSAGQTFYQAAEREIFEELGLRINASELKNIGIRKLVQDTDEPLMHNREFVQVYLMEWDGNPLKLKLQKAEVERIKFVPLEEFEHEVNDPKKLKQYTPLGGDYFAYIIKSLKQEMAEKGIMQKSS